MSKPHLWIIAGPNGAGKTTLVQSGPFADLLSACEFINPDAITLAYLQESGITAWKDASKEMLKSTFIKAADDAEALLYKRMEEGAAVVIESVLSTSKYRAVVERVLELQGRFMLIYLALDSAALSQARVLQRTLEGGHDVPAEKLERRWKDSLGSLPWFATRAHRFWILDNSKESVTANEQPIVSGSKSAVSLHLIPSPSLCPAISEVISSHAAGAPAGLWHFNISTSDMALSAA
ncbi:putative ABC-type ATPase [Prosthecobacter fusiformis]|uniref:Putative ABC-type ATPase n=1 Tax=Prosthecobacter fusiformis TaxID=48464 RepID=A0A4R7RSG6_9BACT|nr:zeta toxin family protein [Prosthecobacter fusiformis]TDU67267.1 putative ABC-type ATPase [Prosthecobacter fusiformis]